ncbi:MAG: phosphoenolpyruvate synthase, partial [Nitrospirae bacterium]|nr:phosphoenolpyruvate synthase [Nitrospirota bacterium]
MQSGSLVDTKISFQSVMLVCNEEGDIMQRPVPDEVRGMPCLSDAQIRTLYAYASALEKHYAQPQDIEWAIDRDGRLCILQSRRLKIADADEGQQEVPRRVEGYTVLLDTGIIACKGIGHGKAFVLRDPADLVKFPQGAVLVARHTSPKFVTIMDRASAIITDLGGVTGHMASLAREYRIPTILDMEIATSTIKDGQEITVDAINCNVYEGKVDALLAYASKKQDLFKDTPLFKTLDKALKWVVPLNLIDPEGANFRPEHCKTFHD